MPKRTDIQSILILGAGPIVIGQACEFDYAGTQAVRALKEEGYRIILVNANPATVMTDPELADSTYIEPILWPEVTQIIKKERPHALLPTMGGQTALNCALDLDREDVLKTYQVEMIGATRAVIDNAEDRERFRKLMQSIGLSMPRSAIAHSLEEAYQVQAQLGFPVVIRPSFTLGGTGGGIAYNRDEFELICENGFMFSPTHEVLIDESVVGWKEFEMEVMRDKKDNSIVVCTIENLDPMGIHTGDSITVAPAQTLTDKEYQRMRNAALQVVRAVGLETGGANVQFAVSPEDGRLLVIEMNPRVSRSSALASKATGFPIAKIAAKLAIGYTLDELDNPLTQGKIPASFEPTLDYVVVKIPRFNFDKFKDVPPYLTTQMKSVGEVMGIGPHFQAALQKAIHSLEIDRLGLEPLLSWDKDLLQMMLRQATPDRIWMIADAFRQQLALHTIYQDTRIDPWFLHQLESLMQQEKAIMQCKLDDLDERTLRIYKYHGFSDARLAQLLQCTEEAVRQKRKQQGVLPSYRHIDSCAGEFPTDVTYLYSSYDPHHEATVDPMTKKVIILGGGPNRIGQGIEFDYCCVHAALTLKEAGFEAIMVNCNPETVSTDVDISSKLYFEPVTMESVLSIVEFEKPYGVIVHYGGQTPLKLAKALSAQGVPILGTSPDAIDKAENRERFKALIQRLSLLQPENVAVKTPQEAYHWAVKLGFPLIIRPSYVLGGRAMEIIYGEDELAQYLQQASFEHPLLLDRFLNDATEVDVDAICDGQDVYIAGIMEHIEEAGVHSGDSACTLPPFSLSTVQQQELAEQMRRIALQLKVVGLINAQFAVQSDDIFVLEVNPRASRTIPFVSKATGVPLVKIATLCMLGKTLREQGLKDMPSLPFFAVKLPVFPFTKFQGTDCILGPEMKSTGEAMGIAKRFGQAFSKAQLGACSHITKRKRVFVSVKNADKARVGDVAKRLIELGFEILATQGTALVLRAAGIPCQRVLKVAEGRPHVVDLIKNGEIDFIINTTEGKYAIKDSFVIRHNALQHKVSYTTTLSGASAACLAMKYEDRKTVTRLQDLSSMMGDPFS